MSKFAVEYTIAGGSDTIVVDADSAALAGKMCPTGQPIRVNQVSDDEKVTDPATGTTSDPTSDDPVQPTQESGGGQATDALTTGDQAGSPEAQDPEAVT